MKKTIFSGSGVAIVTPFKDDIKPQVDYDKFAELIEWQIASGTDAIILTGTTGEASTMPDAEHIEVIAKGVEIINKRVPAIAGVGSNDTVHAINLAIEAERTGADALLCVTPYYNKASQEGLYQHFAATANAVSLPIILYNVPSRTNCNIAPSTYQRLAAFDNIVASKECNFAQLAECMDLCGEDLDFYSGEDGLILPLMAMGGKGVISVLANIVPQRIAKLTHDFLGGHLNEAASQQIALSKLIKAMFCDVNPIPVKAALDMMGKAVGPCRLPLCNPSESNLEFIRKTLKEEGLI